MAIVDGSITMAGFGEGSSGLLAIGYMTAVSQSFVWGPRVQTGDMQTCCGRTNCNKIIAALACKLWAPYGRRPKNYRPHHSRQPIA